MMVDMVILTQPCRATSHASRSFTPAPLPRHTKIYNMMVFQIADWWRHCWFLVVCWCSLLRLGARKCNWSLLLALGNIWSPSGSVASRYLAAIRERPKQMLGRHSRAYKMVTFRIADWWWHCLFLVVCCCSWLRLGAPDCFWSLLLAPGNFWSPFGSVAGRCLAHIRERPWLLPSRNSKASLATAGPQFGSVPGTCLAAIRGVTCRCLAAIWGRPWLLPGRYSNRCLPAIRNHPLPLLDRHSGPLRGRHSGTSLAAAKPQFESAICCCRTAIRKRP